MAADINIDLRLERLNKACTAVRWELKSLLGDGDRLPVDLTLALQSLDGKAELAAILVQQRLNGTEDGLPDAKPVVTSRPVSAHAARTTHNLAEVGRPL